MVTVFTRNGKGRPYQLRENVRIEKGSTPVYRSFLTISILNPLQQNSSVDGYRAYRTFGQGILSSEFGHQAKAVAWAKWQVTNGRLQYNFTALDNLMDRLWENKLVPGFELMGNPTGCLLDFEDKEQVVKWRNLIAVLASRYIDRYGLEHVAKWNFETWNEPDHHDFDNVSMTVKGEHVLKHLLCGKVRQGGGSSLNILQQEIEAVQQIQKLFPNFSSVAIYNDEADPMVGWSIPQPWRADVTYAAMVVKVIIQHQNLLISKSNNTINYTLLSNDNAFLSYYPHYFTQRTLTARFQMNNTKPPHVQMVRKPVLTVMGLLALQGEKQIFGEVKSSGTESTQNSTIGVLASVHTPSEMQPSDSWQATILMYSSEDNRTSSNISTIRVNATHFPNLTDLVYVTYYLDNNQTNPYLKWKNLGSPDFPSPEQFQQIRGAEVTGVRLIPLTKGQVTVLWDDDSVNSKCIKTYEVEFSSDGKAYQRINAKNTIFTLFVYSPGSSVSGFYRVRAIDYWGKAGLSSPPVGYVEASK
ncbi:Alpha-L-iduronidase [Willisornis vidua]|uniref:Alpha-L-iduronidase n=1 Tax=Willisornis vidua TaxID=1566151 RepID=A0ABQ9CPJ7_9PASS|nr:Alpha-L-iduronidase [Willisornis vidua]